MVYFKQLFFESHILQKKKIPTGSPIFQNFELTGQFGAHVAKVGKVGKEIELISGKTTSDPLRNNMGD